MSLLPVKLQTAADGQRPDGRPRCGWRDANGDRCWLYLGHADRFPEHITHPAACAYGGI